MKNFGTFPRTGGTAARLALALLLVQGYLLPHFAFAASGDSTKAKSSGLPIKAITAAMLSYARSIGCSENVDPRQIVEIPQGYDLSLRGEYLVTYSVDVGCEGGSTSAATAFGVVQRGSTGGLYVDPELSRPEATVGFPSNIVALNVRNGEIFFTAKDFDFSKDALCCPSAVVSGKIRLETTHPPDKSDLSPEKRWVREPAPTK